MKKYTKSMTQTTPPTYTVTIEGGAYLETTITNNEHNDIFFLNGFDKLSGKVKLKAINKLIEYVLENEVDKETNITTHLIFDIRKNERDGEWLMHRLDNNNFKWFNDKEKIVGINEGEKGIFYCFSDSLANLKTNLLDRKKLSKKTKNTP